MTRSVPQVLSDLLLRARQLHPSGPARTL